MIVEASDDLSGVESVSFSAYYNEQWYPLGEDSDGSDGWQHQCPTYNLPDQLMDVRAVIRDRAGNETTIIVSNISPGWKHTIGNGYESRRNAAGTTASNVYSIRDETSTSVPRHYRTWKFDMFTWDNCKRWPVRILGQPLRLALCPQ
jgi:hypothetical protein